jgi:hypothetical protein
MIPVMRYPAVQVVIILDVGIHLSEGLEKNRRGEQHSYDCLKTYYNKLLRELLFRVTDLMGNLKKWKVQQERQKICS